MSDQIEWIQLEDYAKSVGVQPEAIQYAIKQGRIPLSAVTYTKVGGRNGNNKRTLINKREADIAWVETADPTSHNRTERGREAVERIKAELQADGVLPASGSSKVNDYAETKRKYEHTRTLKAQLELLEYQGKLVQKDKVYKQLFEAGQQLRDAILGLPLLIKRKLAQCGGDEFEIEKILNEELTNVLSALTEIYNRKLQ